MSLRNHSPVDFEQSRVGYFIHDLRGPEDKLQELIDILVQKVKSIKIDRS